MDYLSVTIPCGSCHDIPCDFFDGYSVGKSVGIFTLVSNSMDNCDGLYVRNPLELMTDCVPSVFNSFLVVFRKITSL